MVLREIEPVTARSSSSTVAATELSANVNDSTAAMDQLE